MNTLRVGLAGLILPALFAAAPANGVWITFEQLPDGTPIQNNPNGCGEITFDSFRPWGVLFTTPDGAELNISVTWILCFSPNRLQRCDPYTGTLNITFVLPGTNVSTAVDSVSFWVLTQTSPVSNNRVNTYNAQGELLDTWAMTFGFCEKPPDYLDFYGFSAPGQIARVECILVRAGIDDVIVEHEATPVEGVTWGRVKSLYR